MNGFGWILSWLEQEVKMHQKRRVTLAHLVVAAMALRGMGVLALGRALSGPANAKHQIKRVWRFLRNDALEVESVHAALLRRFAPASGPLVILVDWTDFSPYTQLVFALPRDGRALPFLSRTVYKAGGEGVLAMSELAALEALARICPRDREVILVADRGFGNQRWMEAIAARGWYFVQRLARSYNVDTDGYIGALHALRVRRGTRAKDFGWGTVGEGHPTDARLVACHARDAKEPWYLATNLDALPIHIVQYYQRRMWIEAMFRDWKNKQWGMGLKAVRLSEPVRHDRLFLILALAYILLCACGALAEKAGLGKALKANTVTTRVMTLLRMGVQLLRRQACKPKTALNALQELPA